MPGRAIISREGLPRPAVALSGLLCLLAITGPAWGDVIADRWKRSGWERPIGGTVTFDPSRAREWEAQPPTGLPTITADNLGPIKEAIKRYSEIVSKGGWKSLPMEELRPGAQGSTLELLQDRLAASGDLILQGGYASRYDGYIEAAVQRFQIRHGITPHGYVDKATVLAMNVPATARLRQLQVNLGRVSTLSKSASKRYVLVNVPSAQIEAVLNNEVVSRHAAVVGKIDRQTPLLRSSIHEINFNPYWHVPQSIVRKDLVPKARQYARAGKDILADFKIEAYDGNGRKLDSQKINWSSQAVYGYAYRQLPWEDNSMGFVKINFHNAHSVYMHDTPSKSLFGRNFRAHSSGCVRVQNVHELVAWLLEDTQGWDVEAVRQIEQSGERKDVKLKRQTPVYFAYITAWATPDGVVNFRRDLYQRDGVGSAAGAY
ncbi:MAG: L,D-transpeptidase family protein [Pseudomonadota bacterium]|nr:L,D-transpeptidase family protein [Pseudomonadota bacterium]